MSAKDRIATSLLLVAAQLSAQTPSAPLILRSTTRLVQMNVVAQDHKGNPITDLKKEDFEIRDAGQMQKIGLFSMESNAPLPAVSEPLPPNTFTNRLEHKSGTPASVSVILLDSLNTKLTDRPYAQAQVVKFLKQIEPRDRIGVYTLGRSLRVLHDYTTDSTELLKRLAGYDGGALPNLTGSETRSPEALQLDNLLAGRGASRIEGDFYTIDRVQGTLRAIEFIANHLSAIPGRKNLIWVSGGFPLMIGYDNLSLHADPARIQRTFSEEIDRTVRAMNNANLAIYPVDARGLVTDSRYSAERRGSANRKKASMPKSTMARVNKNQDSMRELASRTGGRAYLHTNDLSKAIREAVQDARVTYTLGFYPIAEKFDGKFHELKVKVNRPGASLRYRKGYFDVSEQPQDEKTRKTELNDAVWSPLEASGIGLVVNIQRDPAKPKTMNVFVKIDARAISLEQQGERWAGRLDMLFVQKDDRGGQFNGTSDTMELQLQRANYEKVSKDGLTYKKAVEMASQANQLRVVVRDAASGTIGTVTIPFREIKN